MIFSLKHLKPTSKSSALLLMIIFGSFSVKAQGPPASSSMSNPFVVMMVVVMAILALAIGLLANVLLGAAQVQTDREKQEKKESEISGKPASASAVGMILVFLLLSVSAMAQDPAAAKATGPIMRGISDTAFYLIVGVLFIELTVMLGLLFNVRKILKIEKTKMAAAEATEAVERKPRVSWWDNFNKFKPIEQETDIDLGHNYDGIRELDNRLPPWWIYGFYGTILFACIYLWRFHVSHTAPLSGEEYQIAMQEAAVQKEAYLKKAANNIDETNVKLLTGASDLAAGKKIFEGPCAACHGNDGRGIVGPNLTDNYWIHGGTISDIFKTIKYGYPEKGMKSWKDDYSPTQMAEVASYIKSMHGSNPANPKAPQGILFTEEIQAPVADSTIKNADPIKRTGL